MFFPVAFFSPLLADFTGIRDFFVAALILVVIASLVVFFVHRYEKKRSKALEDLMRPHGFIYEEDATNRYEQILGNFKLGKRGRNRRLKNLFVSKEGSGGDIMLFENHFTEGSGKSAHTYLQTVLLVTSDRLDMPAFHLGPEGLFHRIGQRFGRADIDFTEYPKFSGMFELQGNDEESIRSLFSHEVITALEQRPRQCLEGLGNQLLIYVEGKRLKPERIEAFLASGTELTSVFFRK